MYVCSEQICIWGCPKGMDIEIVSAVLNAGVITIADLKSGKFSVQIEPS